MDNPAVEVLARERDQLAANIEAKAAELRADRERLRGIEEGIAKLTGDPVPVRVRKRKRPSGPTVQDLILGIVVNFHTVGLTRSDISEKLAEGGRETSDNSVLSQLSRLKRDGRIYKQDGRWYASDGEIEAAKQAADQNEASADASETERAGPARPAPSNPFNPPSEANAKEDKAWFGKPSGD